MKKNSSISNEHKNYSSNEQKNSLYEKKIVQMNIKIVQMK